MNIVTRAFDSQKSMHPPQNHIFMLWSLGSMAKGVWCPQKSSNVHSFSLDEDISITKGKTDHSLGLGFCDGQDYFWVAMRQLEDAKVF